MAAKTGIGWTDSTCNPWWGCTKVGPACDDCYAEVVDDNASKMETSDGVTHWGHGAPRRRMSEHARHEPYRWNKNADRFEAEHGRRRRVFTLSMGDLFDNEVDPSWRREHFQTMRDCIRLEWQICTKRVSNIPKMVPADWRDDEDGPNWPRNVGVLVTIVTQAEADRDLDRLVALKRAYGIPWIGVSYEPAQEQVDFRKWLNVIPVVRATMSGDTALLVGLPTVHWAPTYNVRDPDRARIAPDLDWIIFGGKSGAKWNDRPFDVEWGRLVKDQCAAAGAAFYFKQVAAFRPTDAMIPPDLLVRQWPEGH